MSKSKAQRILIKTLKVMGWIAFSLIALLIVIAIAIQVPWVQNKIKQKAVSFLHDKIGTPVSLDHFSLSFPKKIVIEGLYVEDQKTDTLLYAGRIGIDTDLWALTRSIIDLRKIELSDIVSEISRPASDSAFNFDYIVKAFIADSTASEDTTASVWDFKFGKLALNGLRFRLDDSLSGNHLNLRLHELNVNTELFDLKNGEVNLGEINVDGVRSSIVQTRLPETIPDSVEIVPEDSAAVALNISFRKIRLKNIEASYDHTALKQVMKVIIATAAADANTIDIKNHVIDLAGIGIDNALISFQQMEVESWDTVAEVSPAVKAHNEEQEPWKFSLGAFDLKRTTLQYSDFNKKPMLVGIDFNNLWVSDLNSRIRNVSFDGKGARLTVNNLSFSEKSGFKLLAFHTGGVMLKDSIAINNFLLRTSNSKIAFDAMVKYPSLQALQKNISSADFLLDIKTSTFSVKDLLFFQPDVVQGVPLELPANATVTVEGLVRGNADEMEIERLQMHTLGSTSLFTNGRVLHALDPDKLFVDLKIDKFGTGEKDLTTILPDTLLPPSVNLPQWISLSGRVKGTLKTPDVNALLTSDFGKIELAAKADLNKNIKDNYKGEIRVHEFQLGEVLGQPREIGQLDMVASVNGSGTSIEELNALIKVKVNRFDYSGYTYRDFTMDGSLKKYFFSGTAFLHDENLNFELAADLDYNKDIPHYYLDFDLKNADFRKLLIASAPLKLRGKLTVDMETPDFRKLNGTVNVHDVGVFNGKKLYVVDSLLFASIDQERKSEITITSDILSGEFKGTINLFSLPGVLGRHINRYFALRDTLYSKPLDEQNFKFNLTIKNTELITEILVPGLEPFVPGEISGEFNSIENDLKLNIGLSQIMYNGLGFDSVSFKTISDDESLDFTLAFHDIKFDTLSMKMLRIAGNVLNDSIHTNLSILDSLGKEKYFLGGVFHSFEDVFQFTFLKHEIMLNYEDWESPLYNSLQFTKYGLDPNNFYITKGEERILLLKKNNSDSTLSLAFREVDLKDITSIVEGITPVSGFIDGEVTLASSVAGNFETDLRIRELGLFEQHWGDLKLLMKKKGHGPTNFDLSVDGPDAEVKADGFFASGAEPEILVRGNVAKINLSIVEPLTFGQLKDLKGILKAEFSVKGKTADPDISGSVSFNNVSFLSTYANSNFNISDETLYLRDDDLVFDKFEILDNKKNKAVIDGLITSADKGGFNLRLNVQTSNFQLLNTDEDDNELFYGKVGLNSKTSITGTSNNPVVQMNVSLSEKSELTYVVPQSEKAVMDQKGVVVFIDKDAPNDLFLKDINPRDTVTNRFTGIELTANIELTETEKFTIIIDPVAGDKLEVQGNSTLTFHIDPSGEMQLTGRYEVSSGKYALSFAKLVKREFQIEKGSTITWSGDPLNADMDIRAMYQVETSPIDLMANQSKDDLSIYKKQSPFQVHLFLKGELLFPEISFELDMPESDRDEFGGAVYAKLKDINTRESDLNKQVFALLILKRFISDNPLESQGGSLANTARQSVSKILSDQLNRLSSNIKGVQLSFDLKSYEDYTGSGSSQTELQLGVSKSMMNDRLVVKVSGNVNIEGEQQKQSSFTDFIGDLALEYKLTEDGRFRITGFRNSNYDLISGDIIETGGGLIYIKDYDSLLELFKPNEKNKAYEYSKKF